MKKYINLIAVVIALLPFAYLAAIWQSLPQTVALHFDASMKPDKMGDKSQLWLITGIMAVVSLGVFFLLRNIHRIDPKRKAAGPSPVFDKLAVGMTVFIAALTAMIIASANGSAVMQNLIFPFLGLLFAFIGNYMINLKPNYFAGIRLPWTLANDDNWKKTHRLGGTMWFFGGLAIAVVTLFLRPEASMIFFIAAMVVMVIVPVVYSYRLFRKQV